MSDRIILNGISRIIILSIILSSYRLNAQSFTNYAIAQGLPSNEVYDIHQDGNGFLWFATDNGVVRYDGSEMKLLHVRDGLSDPVVFGFHEDSKKRLWFRTYSGRLSYFDPEKSKIYSYKYNDKISSIVKSGLLFSLSVDAEETVYLSNGKRLIQIDKTGKITGHNFPLKTFLYKKDKEKFIIGFNPEKAIINSAVINDVKLPIQLSKTKKKSSHVVCTLTIDEKLYFSLSGDLFEYHQDKIKKILSAKSIIVSLSKDINNFIWVGLLNNGVDIIQANPFKIKHFELFDNKSVTRVIQDSNKGYWFSTLEDGVYYVPNKDIKSLPNLNDLKTTSVLFAHNEIILGDQNGYLHFFDPKTKKEKNTINIGSPIMSLFEDDENKLWVSTGAETFIFDSLNHIKKKITRISKISFSQNHPRRIWGTGVLNTLFDIDGNIMKHYRTGTYRSVLTMDSLLLLAGKVGMEIRNQNFTLISSPKELQNTKIRKFDHLNDTTFLLSSIGNGPILFNPYKGTFNWLVNSRKFPANNIYAAIKNDSMLWLGSEKGVFKIRIKDLLNKNKPFKHLSKRSGLIDDKVDFMIKVERDLWVFTDNGISIIPLTHKEFDDQNPKFYIKDLFVNNEKLDTQNNQEIELQHEQNYIRLDVGFISFNNQDIRIRFKVTDGDEWSYTNSKSIEFFSLSPGKYNINLQFTTNNIVWSTGIKNLAIYIKPPWWGIWYFQLVIGMLILSWITFFILTQISLIRQKQIYLQSLTDHQQQLIQSEIESIEKERSRIAKDLHDGIGTTLTSVKMRVNQVLNQYNQSEANTIENRLQDILREVKNIIYDLTPPTLMQFGLHEGLKNYIEKVATGTHIEIKLNIFGQELNHPKINLFIFRIIQELVINSLKHSNAKNITIHLSSFDDLINILYQDDGNGFLNHELVKGHGLYNIESRIQSLHGKILFETSTKGVSYSIDIPL